MLPSARKLLCQQSHLIIAKSIMIMLCSCDPAPRPEKMTEVSIDMVIMSDDQSLFLDQSIVIETKDMSLVSDIEVANEDQAEDYFPLPPAGYPLFRFPINKEDLDLINPNLIFGVDHDPARGNRIRCENYAGRPFPNCYDEHQGSDFMLVGGFNTMDNGSARVVAALEGLVVASVDGNYDRCHADITSADISCDEFPIRPNYVSIEHSNGWISNYYHLKRNSVRVAVGDRVSCGTELGLVGSSGYSSGPHLHFEVKDSFDRAWDPYAGDASQRFSLWVSQVSSDEFVNFPSTSCSSP